MDTDTKTESIIKAYQQNMMSQYESSATLPRYKREQALFTCVKNGDENALETQLAKMHGWNRETANSETGQMSFDPFRQAQYIVVSGITLATRYALAGGLSEAEAFRLSDTYLQKLNRTMNEEEAIRVFMTALHDFTRRVAKAKMYGGYSYVVMRCIRYIANHLHDKITLTTLAKECHVAPQYLSTRFHKETQMTVLEYIRNEKLKIAAQMLEMSEFSINRIATILDFPSQSAFAIRFKSLYGLTPTEYRRSKFS